MAKRDPHTWGGYFFDACVVCDCTLIEFEDGLAPRCHAPHAWAKRIVFRIKRKWNTAVESMARTIHGLQIH